MDTAKSTLAVIAGWFALGAATAVPAQTPSGTSALGAIEGRAFNPATGENIELARITVEGTALETFTDADGQYRLAGVPVGTLRVRAFRTGNVAQTLPATVAAGQATKLNFEFASLSSSRAGADGTVKLDQFHVGASREMDGAAIAINTQRFAPNAMAVIAADEFGPVANGNAGELLKSVPGITLSLGSQGEMYQVAMNGVPPNNVPITVGGFDLGNPAGGTTRGAGLHLLSLNNASRIEVAYTPTPDTTGSALAGTVNLVPRSAFERSRPVYNISLGVLMRDNDITFRKTPGPQHEPRRKVNPEVMLSAVVPLSPRLGFTLSASTSGIYTPQDFVQSSWRGVSAATNGGTLPDTTPDRPYLTDFLVRDRTAQPERRAFAATFDFKLTPSDVFSLAFQYGYSGAIQSERTLTFLVNRVAPGNFSTTFTRGFAGAGEIRITNDTFDVAQRLYMPTLTYRHNGPEWRFESGAGFSSTNRKNRDINKGFFRNSQARRQNVTVSFDDIFYLRPRVVTVTDANGAPVDPYSIDSYSLNTATGNPSDSFALQRNLFANARRDFAGSIPITLKAGFDVRQSLKDLRADNPTYTYVGADARASRVLDESISERPGPFGFPRIGWVHNRELFDLYRTSPASFSLNEAARYQQAVAASKFAAETIAAGFVRGDVTLFNGRLKLVGGLRAEQTNAKGEGQLIDPTRNYQRDGTGRVLLGANGRPLTRTADALEIARLTRIDRGLHAEKEYLRLFPSLNAAFNLRENLVARAGYYQSVGRPDLVQYAGSLTLPDTESPPGPGNVLAVNNAAIKAWQAHTFKAGLEYYIEPVGLFSVSAFRREIENFFGNAVFRPDAEFLALYGLNPATYGGYDVSTQYNLPGVARMTGLDVSYKQSLTFLPSWARGVSVFANASAIRTTGDAAASFNGFTPRTYNWGASLARDTYSLRLRWNYAARARRGLVAAGRSIDPATYNWNSKRLLVDLNGEYRFSRRIAVFANIANMGDAPVDLEISGPITPEHAQLRQRQQWGATWTIGITGTF